MKKIILPLLLFICFSTATFGQEKYDPQLAEELGADEYGMKKYIIAFLYRGDKVAEYSEEERAKFQEGHMANIGRLAQEGKMVLAGPFFGNEELRGLFFFDVESIEEAEALTNTDPAIRAGILKMDLKEWYGSATLGMLMEMHEKVAKVIM